MNPYDVVNAVFWLGISAFALIIGSSIAILVQTRKYYRQIDNLRSSQVEFDEFYDASGNISFEKICENQK